MGEMAIPQREHLSIIEGTDTAYSTALMYAAKVQYHLQVPIGNPRQVFEPFYLAFVSLYYYTFARTEMKPFAETGKKIEHWMGNGIMAQGVPKAAAMREGVELFNEWQSACWKAGVISVRK